jgi:hypothetical protein
MVALAVLAGGWLVVRAIGGVAGGGSLTSSGAPTIAAPTGDTVVPGAAASTELSPAGTAVSSMGTAVSSMGTAVSSMGTAVSSTGTVRPTPGQGWVVRPGDTLWGIVEAAGVRGDPRPVVDKLAAELGDQPLQVGQTITVP